MAPERVDNQLVELGKKWKFSNMKNCIEKVCELGKAPGRAPKQFFLELKNMVNAMKVIT